MENHKIVIIMENNNPLMMRMIYFSPEGFVNLPKFSNEKIIILLLRFASMLTEQMMTKG